jgi:hypothetical protein
LKAIWESLNQKIEEVLHKFDNEVRTAVSWPPHISQILQQATVNAQQCQVEYQDEEDRIVREATETALSLKNERKQNIACPVSSRIEAIQQEKHRAEREWVR